MTDPLAQVVGLLQPSATHSKLVTASGGWRIRRSEAGQPFYCAVLDGSMRLSVGKDVSLTLERGDFVLIPAAYDFEASSLEPGRQPADSPIEVRPGVFRLGDEGGDPRVRMLIGHSAFRSDDAELLVSLLPRLVHVRGEPRLTTLVELVDQEAHDERPGRDVVLARLLEVLLIEALRSTAKPEGSPGLLRGLADERLAASLRLIHGEPTRPWTVAALASSAALSRSAFFDRFRREVGVTPMGYLLSWRMALAKRILGRDSTNIGKVAEQVGYSSASTFSIAFARHVGSPPRAYSRAQREQ